jgi:hypothetical protein
MNTETSDAPDRRLDEYDEIEWRAVARQLRPDWTDEDLQREWRDFQAMKAAMSDVGGRA